MNNRPIDKSKKSNIKCEHCRYGCEDKMHGYWCRLHDKPKNYWNRCKDFKWNEDLCFVGEMKVKRIIEIPEEQYNDIVKYLTDNDGNYAYSDFNLREIIRNGTPYNQSDDCISREALRKEVTEKVNFTTVDGHIAYDKMLKLIDNAQAIPLPNEQIAWEQGYEAGLAQGKQDRTKGEWIPKRLWDNTHIWVCSECGNQNKHGITVEKACWKCGARMKGGAE